MKFAIVCAVKLLRGVHSIQPVELDVRYFLALCAAFYAVISEHPCLLSNGRRMEYRNGHYRCC